MTYAHDAAGERSRLTKRVVAVGWPHMVTSPGSFGATPSGSACPTPVAPFGTTADIHDVPGLALLGKTKPEMVGTTRSRGSFFMNKFRKLGFVDYNGGLQVHSSLLSVVLHD